LFKISKFLIENFGLKKVTHFVVNGDHVFIAPINLFRVIRHADLNFGNVETILVGAKTECHYDTS